MSVRTRAADRDMLQILQASFSSSHGSSQPMGWTRHSRRGRTVYNPKVGAMALHPFPVSTSPLSGTKTAMSTLRRLLVVVLALVALAPGLAGQSPAAGQSAIPKLEFEKYTLPNGLQVILHVDRKLPIVHVNQWFHVGSKNEKRGRTGFAHLFEHMMFQGSKNASDEYFVYAEKAGANLAEGGVNGTTEQRPHELLRDGAVGESRKPAVARVGSAGHPARHHRHQEARRAAQRRQERTAAGTREPAVRTLVPACCSKTRSTTATRTRGRSSAAWRTCRRPRSTTSRTSSASTTRPTTCRWSSRATSTPRKPRSSSRSTSATCPLAAPLDRPARNIATLDGERVVEVNDRVSLERVYFGWPAPEYFSEGDTALDIAARILADGLSSRLNKALVYDKPLATQVSAFNVSLEIASVFVVQATARPGTSLSQIESGVTAEIARLAKEGPSSSGARARQDQAGSRVRLRAGADRRVRRQGRRAQPVQRVPGRPEQDRGRPGEVPGAHARGGAASCRQVDRHAQQGRDPFPS